MQIFILALKTSQVFKPATCTNMKSKSVSLQTNMFTAMLSPSVLFFSCGKEKIESSQPVITEGNSEASVFKSLENGYNKLGLRPGPNNGQDVYVDKLEGTPTGNLNYVPELPINQWTISGLPIITRSFIKFEDVSLVPVNAHVVSAKLFLYGMSSSLNTPQGNFGDNSYWVQQVVGSDWDEATLTYDNQPSTTTTGQAELTASTSQWNYNVVVDVTEIVKKIVVEPSANFGFGIKLKTERIYRSIVFASSEASRRTLKTQACHYLSIVYRV